MSNQASILAEPLLEFRHNQAAVHPRDGLSIFGPLDADLPSHPANISYGLVGTTDGMHAFRQFAARIAAPVLNEGNDLDRRLWPLFPGFEAAFGAQWTATPTRENALDSDPLLKAAMDKDANIRAGTIVDTTPALL